MSASKALAATVAAGVAAFAAYALITRVPSNSERARRRVVSAGLGASSLREELQVAIELAWQCGANMVSVDRDAAPKFKDDANVDPVTATDEENERLVVEGLRQRFPEHKVIGEEECAAADRIPALDDSPTWIVDPIDGTANFIHACPLSCVSIGLCHKGRPVLGVVYDPYADELFMGVLGEGAYLCEGSLGPTPQLSAVKATSVTTLQKALLLTDPGYCRSFEGIEAMIAAYKSVLHHNVQAFRALGSSVLSIVWVACGRADGFFIGLSTEGGKPWDYCAAHVIATEAGASFRRIDARTHHPIQDASNSQAGAEIPFDIYSRSCVVAGTAALADDILSAISS